MSAKLTNLRKLLRPKLLKSLDEADHWERYDQGKITIHHRTPESRPRKSRGRKT